MKWLEGECSQVIKKLKETRYAFGKEIIEIEEQVKEMIQRVAQEGDRAVKEYTKKFDRVDIDEFLISKETIEQAYRNTDSAVIRSLEEAKENIISYHQKQKQYNFMDTEKEGVLRGQLVLPLSRVGVYVPGGTAAYPSSVLMNVLPAKIAGVDSVFQVGGTQAIAALAYGTQTIPQVDKIVGPGNSYVALAKKHVFGTVGIDLIAGPSEIGVIADETASPKYIAADMLSQAEHDVLARAILVTPSRSLAKKVDQEILSQVQSLPRKKLQRKPLKTVGK